MQLVQGVTCAAGLAGLLFLPGCGRDQSDQSHGVVELRGPDMVPKELVTALLAMRGPRDGGAPELLVGRRPESGSSDVPAPKDARLVGSLAYRSGGTIVYAVTQHPVDAVRGYEEVLRRAGWRTAPRRAGGGFQRPDPVYGAQFCKGDDHSLSFSAAAREKSGSFLQLFYSPQRRDSPCGDGNRPDVPPHLGPMPSLYPPDRASMLDGGGMGGGHMGRESYARLKTELTPAQLLAHYAAQVRAQGWTLESESVGSRMSAQTWRTEDADGRTWLGLLFAQSIPGSDERDVFFRVIPQTYRR